MSRTPFLRSALVAGAAAAALAALRLRRRRGPGRRARARRDRRGRLARGPDAQHRLRDLQPAEPHHQGPGLARGRRASTVNWVQSAGSNKANEALRAGAIDVGSTAGSAALLARSNGSPIQVIDIYSQPEWAALVAPDGSPIASVADLKGKQIAATKGTDPYFFLLQSLEAEGLAPEDITVQNLQHADGWAALQNGVGRRVGRASTRSWPAPRRPGAKLFYRNVDFNSYGFLNATESFLAEKPEVAQAVVDAYETARAWAAENPEETAAILAERRRTRPAVATKVIDERSNLDVDTVPGDAQVEVLEKIGPIFVELGDVATQQQVDEALGDRSSTTTFVTQADAGRFELSAPGATPMTDTDAAAEPLVDHDGAATAGTSDGATIVAGRSGASVVAPPARRRARRRRRHRVPRSARRPAGSVVVGGAIIPVALLRHLAVVSTSGLVPVSQLPSPEMVWLAAVDLAQRGLLGQYVAISTQRVLIGFAFGASLGLAFGAVVGLSPPRRHPARADARRDPRRAVARLGAAADPVVQDRRGVEDHPHRDRRVLPGLHDRRGRAAARRPPPARGRTRVRPARRARCSRPSSCPRSCRRSSRRCASRSRSRGSSSWPPSSSRRRWASASCSLDSGQQRPHRPHLPRDHPARDARQAHRLDRGPVRALGGSPMGLAARAQWTMPSRSPAPSRALRPPGRAAAPARARSPSWPRRARTAPPRRRRDPAARRGRRERSARGGSRAAPARPRAGRAGRARPRAHANARGRRRG